MSEFVEVMRQFNRMCKANAGCFNCPLHEPDGVSDRCSIEAFVNNPERIKREVMQWAAEHPEPVYPTWAVWLMEYFTGRPEKVDIPYLTGMIVSRCISADIAQKLGIEPKEDA